jgi:2-dehydro-3-deoxyphosphogluconate aldolase/(4S)-4-hydroxy-2-oxoglutarate aldolase
MTILASGRIIGIVRYRRAGDLAGVLHALADGGVTLCEITLDTPAALAAIAEAADAGAIVGAGTVLEADQVRASADAGARFVVSPAILDEVVRTALDLGLDVLPGVLSPTELVRARSLGAEAVKVFPCAPAGGPALIGALRAPFPDIGLVPTGGIGLGDVAAYLAAGADAVGLGSALVGSAPPASDRDLDAIRGRAASAVAAAATA